MYFQRTLEDWAKFDINNRTKFDAAISSGLLLWQIKNTFTHRLKKSRKLALTLQDIATKVQ